MAQAMSLEYRGDTAYVSGRRFDLKDDLPNHRFDLKPDVRTVSLNSGGGNLAIAMFMAKAIANRKLQTRVEKGHECSSGCLYVFVAGREPSVDPTARVGIHTARFDRQSGFKKDMWKELGLKTDPGSPEEIASMMRSRSPGY